MAMISRVLSPMFQRPPLCANFTRAITMSSVWMSVYNRIKPRLGHVIASRLLSTNLIGRRTLSDNGSVHADRSHCIAIQLAWPITAGHFVHSRFGHLALRRSTFDGEQYSRLAAASRPDLRTSQRRAMILSLSRPPTDALRCAGRSRHGTKETRHRSAPRCDNRLPGDVSRAVGDEISA